MSHNRRIENILSQLNVNVTASKAVESALKHQKSDDDIVIVSALRTPITKAKRGGLKDTPMEDLLATVFKATLDKTKIDPKLIEDIIVGVVLGPGSQVANSCRIAQFLAGMPDSIPIHTINRQCSSGLQAIAHVAANIQAGHYEIGLAAGVESMSNAVFKWEGSMNPKVFLNKQAKDCLLPMGITSENVAKQWNISRKEQDEFAVLSHKRAAEAQKLGKFTDEIVPVKTKLLSKEGAKEVTIAQDDGIRGETSFEGLRKLRPAFDAAGSTTAGNASQVSDGASAVLLMRRGKAREMGLEIMGRYVTSAVVGVPPSVMGVGPAFAIPEALKKAGLDKNDVDVYEINEAFASQALMSVKHIGLDMNKVNPNGGAIALGHPLGCTGARMTAGLLSELKRQKKRFGVVSMCIGSGMGMAGIFENERL